MAALQQDKIKDVINHIDSMQGNRWTWTEFTICDPMNITIPQTSVWHHKAFLYTHSGQILTSIVPLVWIWTDQNMLSGRWCLIVTTYIEAHSDLVHHSHLVYTGLVPLTTARCRDQGT